MNEMEQTWRQRYEQLVELMGLGSPILADIERDGVVSDDNRIFLGAFRVLLDEELRAA